MFSVLLSRHPHALCSYETYPSPQKVPVGWFGCTLDAPSDPYFNLLESAAEYISLNGPPFFGAKVSAAERTTLVTEVDIRCDTKEIEKGAMIRFMSSRVSDSEA